MARKHEQPIPIETEVAPDEEPEIVPEAPPKRKAEGFSPELWVAGEVTSWRIARLAGANQETLYTVNAGQTIVEWPIEQLSAAELRVRWGAGEYRITWLRRIPGHRLAVWGNPTTVTIAAVDAPLTSRVGGSGAAASHAAGWSTDVPIAPPTQGILRESFGYFSDFTGMFMRALELADTRAERRLEAERARDRDAHERHMKELEATSDHRMRMAETQMNVLGSQVNALHAMVAEGAKREEAFAAVHKQALEIIREGMPDKVDGDEEAEEEGEEEAEAVAAELVATPVVAAPPDPLQRMTDAGVAIAGAVGNFGQVVKDVSHLIDQGKSFLGKDNDGSPTPSAPA